MEINLAKFIHEVNRLYCQMIGDNSQLPYEEAPDWQTNSVDNGIKDFIEKNGKVSPEETHNSWMKQKIEGGWIYGEVKDSEKKTHPCIRPYSELPVEQRTKDHLFLAICKIFLGGERM